MLASTPCPGRSPGRRIVGDVATVDIRAPRAVDVHQRSRDRVRRRSARAAGRAAVRLHARARRSSTADQQLGAFDELVAPVDAAFAAILTTEARQIGPARGHCRPVGRVRGHARQASDRSSGPRCAARCSRVLEPAQRQEVRDTLLRRRPRLDRQPGQRRASRPTNARSRAEIVAPLVVANSTFDAGGAPSARATTPRTGSSRSASRSARARSSCRPASASMTSRARSSAYSACSTRSPTRLAPAAGSCSPALAGRPAAGLGVALPAEIWHRNSALLLIALMLSWHSRRNEGDRRPVGAALLPAHRGSRPPARRAARQRRGDDRDRDPRPDRRRRSSARSSSRPTSSSAAWPASSSSAAASG